MYHFVGFAWDSVDSDASIQAAHFDAQLRASSPELQCVFDVPGLQVFAAQPRHGCLRPLVLPSREGVVLGQLFPMEGYGHDETAKPLIDKAVSQRIAATRGRWLTERYWGNYVAFLKLRDDPHTCVIRDCSGALPCYRTVHGRVNIFFADLGDLAPLQLPTFTINEKYLAALIYWSDLQIRESAFNEVSELLAGESVEIGRTTCKAVTLWDPRKVAARRTIEDFDAAGTELRTITQDCANAWASVHRRVLMSLSGGLDSAIVLGCIRRAPSSLQITAFNQYRADTAGDERSYAQRAAHLANVELIERPWSGRQYTPQLFNVARTVKPTATDLHFMLEIGLRNALAKEVKAEAVLTGQGGDHLFWALRVLPIAADYLHRHRIGRGLARVIADEARLAERSYLSVLRSAFRVNQVAGTWFPNQLQPQAVFVNRDALPDRVDEYIAHPWKENTEDLPKVKHLQIYLLADVLNRHRHLPRCEYAYERHPLLSQPLIELCLQIPTYTLASGGRQRALARRVFSDCVPQEIINREDKGDFSAQERETFRQSGPFLRDLLLGGLLAKNRIVHKAELERYLVAGESLRPEHIWPLRACIGVELWAETWARAGLRIAA